MSNFKNSVAQKVFWPLAWMISLCLPVFASKVNEGSIVDFPLAVKNAGVIGTYHDPMTGIAIGGEHMAWFQELPERGAATSAAHAPLGKENFNIRDGSGLHAISAGRPVSIGSSINQPR